MRRNLLETASGLATPAAYAREPGDRYVPRSLNGGLGWGVWDARDQRFIDDAELSTLSYDEIRYARVEADA